MDGGVGEGWVVRFVTIQDTSAVLYTYKGKMSEILLIKIASHSWFMNVDIVHILSVLNFTSTPL